MYLENMRRKSAMTDYCLAAILPEKNRLFVQISCVNE